MSDELTNPHISAVFGHYKDTVFPLLGGRQYSLTIGQGVSPCPNMVNAGESHDHIRKVGSLCGC